MNNIKQQLKEHGMQLLRDLLVGKPQPGAAAKKASLDDIPLDDLRREKIRLEQEERKMLARLKDLEKQKRQHFEEGVRNASDREQRVIARRIKELDVEANNMDRMLQVISKQMRTLNGLVQLKERTRMASESGLNSLLQGMDLQDLITYINKASVDGEFHMDKFDELLGALEEADSISPDYAEDRDVLDIMKAMQSAREASDNPEALEERYTEMSQKIAQQQELENKEEEL